MPCPRNRPSSPARFAGLAVLLLAAAVCPAVAQESAGGDPKEQRLALPYAFYNKAFGGAVGYVYGGVGFPQPQAMTLATVIVGSNSAYALYLLARDLRLPVAERLRVDIDGAVSHFGDIQSYIKGNPAFPNERAGSNDSDANDFVEGSGSDNLVRVNFKYLLPLGSGRNALRTRPVLVDGLPVETGPGGPTWNPLESGRTYLEVKPYWRSQTIDSDYGTFSQKTNGAAFSLYRDNTDLPLNPSRGSAARLRYTKDWGLGSSTTPYTVADMEIAKYLSLGSTANFRQRVLALDVWTADATSWNDSSERNGAPVAHHPPAYLGATLGGLWRMRGFPTSRFNDHAAIYYAAEYRVIPQWNPFDSMPWVKRHLGIAWWQWVAFAEAGRVAPSWNMNTLNSAMKTDFGLGVRAMAKGLVVRVDLAYSHEGAGTSMIVAQPFQQ